MKNIKKIIVLGLSILLLSNICLPCYAKDEAPKKEEVIYIMTDVSGNVDDIEVVNIFYGGDLIDYGDYSNVKILNTNDEIIKDGDKISISSNADKLYYQGTLKDNTIPWNISVTYYLDGKKYLPSEIVGKSGKLKIHFVIDENKNCRGSFYDDYALQASFTLDSDLCKNIVVDNATVANVGSDKQITYTILPGKGIDTTISADVKDFKMDSVNINGVRLNIDFDIDDEELMDKVDEIISAIKNIDDGAIKLNDGTGELSNATNILNNKVGELDTGVASLTSGAGDLYSGLESITENNEKLNTSAYSTFEGLCTASAIIINAMLKTNGMEEITLTPSTYSEVLMALLEKLDADKAYKKAYDSVYEQVKQETDKNQETIYQTYIKENANTFYAYAARMTIYSTLIENKTSDEANAYLDSTDGQKAIAEAVGQLGDDQKQEILKNVTLNDEQKTEIKDAYIKQVMVSSDITNKISEVVSKISEAAGEVLKLKGQLDGYKQFYDGLLNYTGHVSEATVGAKNLKTNMGVLYSNTTKLKTSVGELNDAVNKLYGGTNDLADGTSEFVDKTSDMDSQISDEIDSMISSITSSDAKIESFVSDKNTNVEAVQFVIKTEAIEKEEAIIIEEIEEKTLTFGQKLLNLFGLY